MQAELDGAHGEDQLRPLAAFLAILDVDSSQAIFPHSYPLFLPTVIGWLFFSLKVQQKMRPTVAALFLEPTPALHGRGRP